MPFFSFVTTLVMETPKKENEAKDNQDFEAESLDSLKSSSLSEFLAVENIEFDSDIPPNTQNLQDFQNVQNSQNPQISITFHDPSNFQNPPNFENPTNPQNPQHSVSHKNLPNPQNIKNSRGSSKWLSSLYDLLIKQHYLKKFNIFGYNNELDNEYILHPKDLESRLMNVQIVCAIILLVYNSIMLMIVIHYKISNASKMPKIVLPDVQNDSTIRGFPHQHLALIYKDGSVYDFSHTSQKFLFKLPSDINYYGYSNNPSGTFFIVKGSLTKKITKFNGKTHRTIQNSEMKSFPENYFHKGLQVGDLFWVWDQRYQKIVDSYKVENVGGCRNPKEKFQDYCKRTLIWYTERQLWDDGPKLPKHLIYPWDATPVNRTAVMIVGIWSTNVRKCVSMVFDFTTRHFVSYPQIEYDSKSADIWSVSITTAIDKNSKRYFVPQKIK